MPKFSTKELSSRTWPDFVRFFSQGNGWDHCGCLAYQGFRAPSKIGKWADKRDWSLELKRKLVAQGLAHGILVYTDRNPVGWCQFGRRQELPIEQEKRKDLLNGAPGWKRQRERAIATGRDQNDLVWRITCFCTDKEFGGHGIAGVALRAALGAIRKQGGGLVEAFPVATILETDERLASAKQWRRDFYKLVKAHGRRSTEVELHMANPPPPAEVKVKGIGEVNGFGWVYGAMHSGTVGMFEREGFTAVSAWGSGPRVVMQKRVRA